MTRRVLPIALVLLAATAAAAGLVAARGPNPDAIPSSEQVQRRVMSPFCPGVLLADCQTRQSAELVGRIEDRIREGFNNRQIDEWLAQNYGENILARPNGALPWMVPAFVLLTGAGIAAYVGNKRDRNPTAAGPVPQPKLRERIDAELETFARSETE